MRFFLILLMMCCCCCARAQSSAEQSFQFVNSFYDEQNPVVSPDGVTMFLTIGNHPENVGGRKDPGDIWVSRLVSGAWSAPVHAGSVLNHRGYNAVAGISATGEQLFLHGHYDPSGAPGKTQGIAISSNTGDGWSRPANISIPYFMNKGLVTGMVSSDGSVFIFSAETYGTRGVEDLYVSINEAGKWSEPRNLGAVINTQFQELCPSLAPDNKTLYFSSNGRKGSGSFDVYAAERLDETWTNWAAPVNMGDGINTSGRELYFRFLPSGYALYTSTVNSDGYGDVKAFYPAEPLFSGDTALYVAGPPADTTRAVAIVENVYDSAAAADNAVRVYGRVVNSKTGEPLVATISFTGTGENEREIQATTTGYSVAIPSKDKYNVVIEAKGFVSAIEKLDINTFQMKELEMNFSLQPAEVGTTVNLKNVLFAQSKADILPESYPELDMVVSFLQANPDVKIELAGHTDSRGIHADNVKLSQQRVNRVKDYLVSRGIDAKRITGKGYGGTKPVASNESEESRRMNRRVEFIIKKS